MTNFSKCMMICVLLLLAFVVESRSEPASFTANGEELFVVGLYYYPSISFTCPAGWPPTDFTPHLQELKDVGFNTIMGFAKNVDGGYVDNAYSYGIHTIVDLARPGVDDLPYYIGDTSLHFAGSTLDLKIGSVSSCPGLLGYYTVDEAYWGHLSDDPLTSQTRLDLTAGKDWLHEANRDPDHPVFYCEVNYTAAGTTSSGFNIWSSIADAFAEDIYPVWNTTTPYPGSSLQMIGSATAHRINTLPDPTKPVFMVLQGCVRGDYYLDGSGRKPLLIESRFMAYDAIVNGAKGIMWWGAAFLDLTEAEDVTMWTDLKQIAGELRDLGDVLSKGTTSTDYTLGSTSLEARMKIYNSKKYLIVANKSNVALSDVNIAVPNWNLSRVEVLFEGRTRSIAGGVFTDTFEPYDVHVYTDRPIEHIKVNDFDGDGKSDLATYRASDGSFNVVTSSSGFSSSVTFAISPQANDVPVAGDFDGDDKADPAVFRISSHEMIYLSSISNYTQSYSYSVGSAAKDRPISMIDIDGDGKTDPCVWNPVSGIWTVRRSSLGYSTETYGWGGGEAYQDDEPLIADWDNDGKSDLIIYRAGVGRWYILQSSNGFSASGSTWRNWGQSYPNYSPFVGDFDGDGNVDLGLRDAGNWKILLSGINYVDVREINYGMSSDTPMLCDYDGDGRTEVGIYRASNNFWFWWKSTTNYLRSTWKYNGISGDIAVGLSYVPFTALPGDANNDGSVDVGDLGILAANYGVSANATWAMGDFNYDGAVDVGDLGILAANYGQGSSSKLDFEADYNKVFGPEMSDDAGENSATGEACNLLGLPLIAGILLSILLLSNFKSRDSQRL